MGKAAMKRRIVAATVLAVVLSLAAVCYADERLIESWEGALGQWTTHDTTAEPFPFPSGNDNFAGYGFVDVSQPQFAPAVTDGTMALSLNFRHGWLMGLQSNYIGLPGAPEHYFDNLIGAERLKLDFSSNAEVSGQAGVGAQANLTLFIQGEYNTPSGPVGLAYRLGLTTDPTVNGVNYGELDVDVCREPAAPGDPVYLQTLSWDLHQGSEQGTYDYRSVPVIPAFDELGGWLEVRFHTNFGWDGGCFILDNLRAVHDATPPMGDFNGDSSVTHADYTLWADYFDWSLADVRAVEPDFFPDYSYLPGSTHVTHGLYTLWADNFGLTVAAPEPATFALLAIGGVMILRRRA